MSLEAVVFHSDDKKRMNDFLGFPKQIYGSGELMQNRTDEAALLGGTHILSKYFKVTPILVYRGKKAVSRAAVTIYNDDNTAYIGLLKARMTALPQSFCSILPFGSRKKIQLRK